MGCPSLALSLSGGVILCAFLLPLVCDGPLSVFDWVNTAKRAELCSQRWAILGFLCGLFGGGEACIHGCVFLSSVTTSVSAPLGGAS